MCVDSQLGAAQVTKLQLPPLFLQWFRLERRKRVEWDAESGDSVKASVDRTHWSVPRDSSKDNDETAEVICEHAFIW